MTKEYFTEEQRIQDIIDEARAEECKKTEKKFKAEIEKKDAEIKLLKAEIKKKEESILVERKEKEESILAERTGMINLLSNNFKLSPEKIADMTGYPLELVNEVLEAD